MALGYVRPAREADAEEITRIQLTTWRTAYASIVPASVLDGLDIEWITERWRASCAQPPSTAHQVFVAVEQSESDPSAVRTVGFAAVGPDTEDDTGGGLITELLVEPRFGRRGHGSRLLSASVALWRANDVEVGYTWVFTRDAAALNFYRSAGWETDGTRRLLEMDDVQVPQLRLHADITELPE